MLFFYHTMQIIKIQYKFELKMFITLLKNPYWPMVQAYWAYGPLRMSSETRTVCRKLEILLLLLHRQV